MIEFKAINSVQLATLSISDDEKIIYVTDTEQVYIEKNGSRTQFRDIVYLSSSSELPIAPLDKIGKVREALIKNGRKDLVEEFIKEAQSGNYDHLLATVMEYVEVE